MDNGGEVRKAEVGVMRCGMSLAVLALSALGATAVAQRVESKCLAEDYKTLVVGVEGVDMSQPIINIESDERIMVEFDHMSRTPKRLEYRIIHLDHNFMPDGTEPIDYCQGFHTKEIDEYEYARNTTFDYTHYQFTVPNDEQKLTISGNYGIEVYDKEEPEKTLVSAVFCVSEDIVGVKGDVKAETPLGVKTKYQQLDFRIEFSDGKVTPTTDEVAVVVRQNERRDNEVVLTAPTYVRMNDFVYTNDKRLTFEAGCEYRKADFSHRVNFSGDAERIKFFRPYYHVDLKPGEYPTKDTYEDRRDENGAFKIHEQDALSPLDIDYSVVHFTYKREEPWLDGAMYVCGLFNYGRLDERVKMEYDFERKEYRKEIVLKNGGYNYLYVFVPAGERGGETRRTLGSYWQTDNDYNIYVYFKRKAEKAERLIAVQTIRSGF